MSTGRCLPVASLLTAAIWIGVPAESDAADWTFQRSYFSHDLPVTSAAWRHQPTSPSAYRPAVAGPYPGFSIHGARRINRVLIQSGSSLDQTILRSDAFHVVP